MLLRRPRAFPRLPDGPARRRFRTWRRTRPFWAGTLLVLGGTELLVVPLSPVTVLVSLGLGGLAALGIGLALIAAGLFLWFLPSARHYVSVNALILSVLSFAATNLGGFLVGMALGIAGSAMGFGWTPRGDRTLAVALPAVLLTVMAGPSADRAEAADAPPGRPVQPVRSGQPGQPVTAAATPPAVTASRFSPHGFTLAGVSHVPTAKGQLKVIVLTMRAASLSDYRLRTRDGQGAGQLALRARSLELRGEVTLHLTRFHGCLEGLVCLTFSPDTLPAPPVIPPFVFMTDVTAEQALVTADTITADGLGLRALPGA
ncbi:MULTISPECIES: DUF6114 domain-containing protein [Streptomyces]|uniref:DUF6114 domain-containing protein n=1 Tax=Streptomyces TaxID=1883 RepID=UPI00163D3587|nr:MULTISPECIES: DUF6114 domain-containing protein [Streptomyces]MBC2879285.1 hypothetical protein [Streptomyces sp. TYQ1024]UBI40116.1 DUF6114 domain-containing protein [Streptomyces mobaraensis]UKW32695.1 DUF6114 domain-containing protein [Streptomyces sp. TYQ1024]